VKIVGLRGTPVTVPAEAPWRWSMGVEKGTTRTIIELETDEGITGIGETYGGAATLLALETAKPFVLGLDPLETGVLQHRLGVFSIGYETSVPPVVRAGIEMACLDAAGKALGRPVSSLLGGALRDRVEVAAYLFYRYGSEDGDGPKGQGSQGRLAPVDSAGRIVERAQELVARHGFRVLKLKGGVFPPDEEFEALRGLRAAFPGSPLVWDPNAAWSVETTVRVGRRLLVEGLDLQYLEDPCSWLEGMSQARRSVDIPFATNMCLVAPEQLAPGIRMRAVDVILADVHFWGGFRANQQMAAVCQAFQLGVGMHSDRELGVSTAAMVHLAAALPNLGYAIDSHYHDQVDDLITEPWRYEEGHFRVPTGPGLGVELDPDKVAFYHRYFDEHAEVNEFYDPWRPEWVPALPLF
jgi:glucarate dehydratase